MDNQENKGEPMNEEERDGLGKEEGHNGPLDRGDGHGHGKQETVIIVDGTPHPWPKEEISYTEVVTLEFPDYPQHPEITYSVKYKHGPSHKPEGTLSPGSSVKIKKGMRFYVSQTGQS
jgi:hypothetical protein